MHVQHVTVTFARGVLPLLIATALLYRVVDPDPGSIGPGVDFLSGFELDLDIYHTHDWIRIPYQLEKM